MPVFALLILAAATFGLCFLADRLFTKLFRNHRQHRSGKTVRANSRYAAFGIILSVIGLAAAIIGGAESIILICGGIIVVIVGLVLLLYYLSFGVYYDEEGFLISRPGKRSTSYSYGSIAFQQLYTTSGGTIIELTMTDGTALLLQSGMTGVYPFLDFAFFRWCRETGRDEDNCPFHDPASSHWFPSKEEV